MGRPAACGCDAVGEGPRLTGYAITLVWRGRSALGGAVSRSAEGWKGCPGQRFSTVVRCAGRRRVVIGRAMMDMHAGRVARPTWQLTLGGTGDGPAQAAHSQGMELLVVGLPEATDGL
jgi:hypothetical protein